MSDRYLSFYFDTSVTPVIYGVCVWSGSAQYRNESYRSPNSSTTSYQVQNIRITLDEIDSGVIPLRDIAAFVKEYSGGRLTGTNNDRVILEKSPEMTVLEKELKKNYKLHKLELVERDTAINEQIAKYSMMFDRDRFFIGDFLVEPDLIFDELATTNLIDPIYSDEQTVFPMTQALLVGCHYLETQYRSHYSAVAGTIKNPFSQDGRFQRRDYRGFNRF